MSYYVKTGFRMSDDDVGLMQYRMIDEHVSVEKVAREFKVSISTAYKVKAAVPAHLVHVSRASCTMHRRRAANKRSA